MAQEIIDHNGVKVGVADMKRYWKEHPDPGFSEARNKATINRVIKHNEQVFKRLRAQLDDETRDRANAVLTSSNIRIEEDIKQLKDILEDEN